MKECKFEVEKGLLYKKEPSEFIEELGGRVPVTIAFFDRQVIVRLDDGSKIVYRYDLDNECGEIERKKS